MQEQLSNKKLQAIALTIILLFLGFFLVKPFYKATDDYKKTVTVTGLGEMNSLVNNLATFYITVETRNKDKEIATQTNNEISNTVVNQIKEFGVEDKDIKTSSSNIYQERIYQETGNTPGDWVANNSIEVKLRNASRDNTSKFLDLFGSQESVSVRGPNFSVDNESQRSSEEQLLKLALQDAKKKAMAIADESGASLGYVLHVQEGGANQIIPYARQESIGLGGADRALPPVEPGSSNLSKQVTATYQLNYRWHLLFFR